jgi:Fe-S-cluster-containing dehydrogenase component
MTLTRRAALGRLAGAGLPGLLLSAAGGTEVCAAAGAIGEPAAAPPVAVADAVAMLYDATVCTGCQACVAACAEANDLPPDISRDGLHQAPQSLNAFTKNIIKLCNPSGGTPSSFVKQQCMHCLEPACVAACPFKALEKRGEDGVVAWEPSQCIGCRYCEVACPYHVPQFEWATLNPRIVKCEFCRHRLADGLEPACTSVCPTHAVIFGPRSVLLDQAKARIEAAPPDKYFERRVYGEHEAGGTQVLYLSHVPFEALGLPSLAPDERPGRYLYWQTVVYRFFAAPFLLYVTMFNRLRQNFVEHERELRAEHDETGVDPQL